MKIIQSLFELVQFGNSNMHESFIYVGSFFKYQVSLLNGMNTENSLEKISRK